jgi:hypothetical protein
MIIIIKLWYSFIVKIVYRKKYQHTNKRSSLSPVIWAKNKIWQAPSIVQYQIAYTKVPIIYHINRFISPTNYKILASKFVFFTYQTHPGESITLRNGFSSATATCLYVYIPVTPSGCGVMLDDPYTHYASPPHYGNNLPQHNTLEMMRGHGGDHQFLVRLGVRK